MELRYGFALNPERARKVEPAITGILDSVTTLPFETKDAECAAVIRAELRRQGQPIGAYDFLIAATALRHGLIMVTANQREFDRVAELVTENWRSS
jgi:tRNA(fMet)-specific endonuclease VapC